MADRMRVTSLIRLEITRPAGGGQAADSLGRARRAATPAGREGRHPGRRSRAGIRRVARANGNLRPARPQGEPPTTNGGRDDPAPVSVSNPVPAYSTASGSNFSPNTLALPQPS